MNILIRTLFLSGLIVTLAGHLSWGGQIQMEFKKGLWPNTYYLIVDNTDSDRAIEFRGGWEKSGEETSYYAVMNNENRYYFSSPIFEEIGIKGMLRIYPGQIKRIPFKLSGDIIKNTRNAVFKGFSFIPEEGNGTTNQKDYRALTITYDVRTKTFETALSDEAIKIDDIMRFFEKDNVHKVMDGGKHISVDQIKFDDSFKAIDIDDSWKPQE